MTSKENNIDDDGKATVQGNLLSQPVNDELKTSYINYAMSVIISGALPDTETVCQSIAGFVWNA